MVVSSKTLNQFVQDNWFRKYKWPRQDYFDYTDWEWIIAVYPELNMIDEETLFEIYIYNKNMLPIENS